MIATRKQLHNLVNSLPEDRLDDAALYLLGLADNDPVLLAAALAPADDEPLSDADVARLREAEDDLTRGDAVSDDELRRDLGI